MTFQFHCSLVILPSHPVQFKLFDCCYRTPRKPLREYSLQKQPQISRVILIMYRQLNIQQFYVLPTQCVYVFCVDLRTNSDYFPIQH